MGNSDSTTGAFQEASKSLKNLTGHDPDEREDGEEKDSVLNNKVLTNVTNSPSPRINPTSSPKETNNRTRSSEKDHRDNFETEEIALKETNLLQNLQLASPKKKCKARIFKLHATPMKTMIFYYCVTAMFPTMDLATSLVTMPAIAKEYGIDMSLTQWIGVAMNLGCAVSGTIAGKLLERFSSVNIFITWSLVGTLTSLASAFSPSFYILLLTRFLTGIALTGMNVTKGYMFRLIPFPERVRTGLFLVIMFFDLGNIVTPLIAGFATEHINWRTCYLISSAMSIVTLLSFAFIDNPFAHTDRKKIDFGGIVLLSCAYIVSAISVSMFGQQAVIIGGLLLLVSLAFFVGFGFLEKRVAHPLIPLKILTGPLKTLLTLHLLIVFYRSATRTLVQFIYSAIYKQSTGFIGVLNAVFGLMETLSCVLFPFLDKRYTTRRIFIVCCTAITIGTATFPFLVYNQMYLSLAVFIVTFTFLNIVTSMTWAVILTVAPISQLSVVSILPNLIKTLSASVGTCIITSLHSLLLKVDYGDLYVVGSDPYYSLSYARAMSVCMSVMLLDMVCVLAICFRGLANYEADRGKRGFSEKRLKVFTD